jgi:hypothetical protein
MRKEMEGDGGLRKETEGYGVRKDTEGEMRKEMEGYERDTEGD